MRHLLLATAALLATGLAAHAECPAQAEVARRAADLLADRTSESYGPGLSMADAQCAQDRLVALLAARWGAPAGYKVGLTNAAIQARYGVPHPLTGVIYRQTVEPRSGAEQPAGMLSVEADLLVRVRDEGINDLAGSRDHVEILRHLDAVIPFIELPGGTVTPGGLLDGPNLVAFNVNARAGVSGDPLPATPTPEFAARLGTMMVVLTDDGLELGRGPGTALLGHPLDVIPWLVADLARNGRRLHPGELISLGGFIPAVTGVAGHTYVVRYEGLAAEPVAVTVRMR